MSREVDSIDDCTPQTLIEAEAAQRLIERLHDANWNDEKQAGLEDWLAASVAHEVAYLRLEAGWKGADRLTALRQSPHGSVFQSTRPTGATKLHAVAVLLLFVAVGAGVYVTAQSNHDQVFATPLGGRETITLGDGSQIELNTNTELRLPPESRTATLIKGEAYFQIKHDASRPFMLTVGNHRVVDLGTKFVVRQRIDKVEVSLVEGKARVESDTGAASPRSAIPNPGDVAIATTTDLTVSRRSTNALTDALSWRTGMIVFRHATLGNAVAELNRYNTVQIRVADSDIENRVFAGKFQTGDAKRFASVVSTALGLYVETRGSEIVISGK